MSRKTPADPNIDYDIKSFIKVMQHLKLTNKHVLISFKTKLMKLAIQIFNPEYMKMRTYVLYKINLYVMILTIHAILKSSHHSIRLIYEDISKLPVWAQAQLSIILSKHCSSIISEIHKQILIFISCNLLKENDLSIGSIVHRILNYASIYSCKDDFMDNTSYKSNDNLGDTLKLTKINGRSLSRNKENIKVSILVNYF